jgi:hypothetical protein
MAKAKIIYKRKLRSFINFIATEIFRASTKNLQNKKLRFDFNYNDEIIKLVITIQHSLSIGGLTGTGFDTSGSSSDEDITMDVYLFDRAFHKTSYNNFQASIREFLRHEIEHIGQYHSISGKTEIYGYPASTTPLEYLTQPYEIDAFLQGLNYRRKYLKTNINDEIDYLIKNYYNIQDDNIFNIIKEKWTARLKEILPHTL